MSGGQGYTGGPQCAVALSAGEATRPVDVEVVGVSSGTVRVPCGKLALPAFAVTATPNVHIATAAPPPTTAATNLRRLVRCLLSWKSIASCWHIDVSAELHRLP